MKNCAYVKKKEWDDLNKELRELRLKKKPDEIIIRLANEAEYYQSRNYLFSGEILGSLKAEGKLRRQIFRIIYRIQTKVIKDIESKEKDIINSYITKYNKTKPFWKNKLKHIT